MPQEIQHKQWQFESNGARLYAQSWQPVQQRAILVIVHGYAEHSGRYAHVAAHFVEQDLAVFSFDLRGHGQSSGSKCYVQRFADYANDLAVYLNALPLRLSQPNLPVFLLGHSMGSAVVLLHAIQQARQVSQTPTPAGLILGSTILRLDQGVSSLRILSGQMVSRVAPTLPVAQVDSRQISRDPAVVKAYQTDPLVYHGGVPAQTGVEMLRVIRQIRAQVQLLQTPLLILHGTEDRLAPCAGSQLLDQISQSPDKTLKLYKGLYHEILNEPEQAEVLADITNWIKQRLPNCI